MATVSRNIFWLSLSRVIGLILLFFAYTQLFSYLGPFGTGQYQFVLSLVTIFGVVIDLGISQYVTKKVAENHAEAPKYFYNFLVAEIVLALLMYGLMVLYVFSRGYEPVIRHAVMVAGGGLFLYGLTVPFLSVLSGFQELRKVAVINFISSLVNVGIILSAVYFDRYIVYLALNQAVAGIIALAVYYYYVRQYIANLSFKRMFALLDFLLLRKIISAAAPFALLVSFSTLYNRIDVVLITRLLGYVDTGLYTTAYKVVDLTNFFPAVVSHSLYPALAALMAKRALGEVKLTLEKYLRFMVVLALPVGVIGSLLSERLILVLTGGDRDFLQSAPILAILVWAIVILFIYVTANSLVVSQLTKLAVVITGVNMVINIVGNIILLPHIGIRGAAIMTVVSESLQGIFYFYFIWKNITHFNVLGQFLKPVVASVAMGAVIYFVRDVFPVTIPLEAGSQHLPKLIGNVALVSGAGFIAYGAVLVLLKFFSRADLLFVKRFIGRAS